MLVRSWLANAKEGRRDITYDWFADPTIGPVIDGAAEKAAPEAWAEALAAQRRILRRLVEKRFGALSEPIAARVASLSFPEIGDLSLRLPDAASLDELFS